MCNQAVCLIAAELERRGITTVSAILLNEVAEIVRPPRALFVPFAHGYPLGAPNNSALQRHVLDAMLAMTSESSGPALASYLPMGPSVASN